MLLTLATKTNVWLWSVSTTSTTHLLPVFILAFILLWKGQQLAITHVEEKSVKAKILVVTRKKISFYNSSHFLRLGKGNSASGG
jgi:hypothetical protein